MNDFITIDFAKLRKLEKLRAKKERLAKQQEGSFDKEKEEGEKQIELNEEDEEATKKVKYMTMVENSKTTNNDDASLTKDVNVTSQSFTPTTTPQCCTSEFLGISNNNIKSYEVKSILKHVYYVPRCLTEEYIQCLSEWLQSLPMVPRDNNTRKSNDELDFNGQWTRLKHAQRNVALFDLRAEIRNKNTPLLDRLCHFLIQIKVFPESHLPNHVLINEYQNMEGIMPHTDGPLYYHKTATFSIGGDVLFEFTKRQQQEYAPNNKESNDSNNVMQIMLSGKGSLIVFDGDAYINHCHSISDRISDEMIEYAGATCVNLEQGTVVKRGHRFSLTFRHKH